MVRKMLNASALFLVSVTVITLVGATAGELEKEVAQAQTVTIVQTQKPVEKQGKVLGLMYAAIVACGENDLDCTSSGGGGSTGATSSCLVSSFAANGTSYTQSPVAVSVSESTGMAQATLTWESSGCHHAKLTQTTNGISSTNTDSTSGSAIVNPFFISWAEPAGASSSTYTLGGYDSSDRLVDSKTIVVQKSSTPTTPATPPNPGTPPDPNSPVVPTIVGAEIASVGVTESYTIFSNNILGSYNGGQMKYTLNWGDGSSESSQFFVAGLSTFAANHAWTEAGTYTITGTATPTTGSESSSTLEVVITSSGTPPPPGTPATEQTSLIVESGVRRDDTIVYSNSTNIKTGENILVRTKITNTGITTAKNIIVKAPLPEGYATFSWAPSPNSEAFTSEGLQIPDLQPGTFRVIDFGPIQVGKLYASTFTISATSQNAPLASDMISVNASLGLMPTVQDMSMLLRVSKLHGDGNYDETIYANVGEPLVFLITVYAGPGISNAKNVRVTVTSPDGLKVSTTNGGDPNFVSGLSNGNTATTTLGDLYPNVAYSTTFVATVTKDGPQSVGIRVTSDNLGEINGSIGVNGAPTTGSGVGNGSGASGSGSTAAPGASSGTPAAPATPGMPRTPATPPTQSGPCKINSFTANQTTVTSGQIIVLNWATQGCNTIRVARDISASINEVPLSSSAIGSVNVGPINANVTFRVYGSKSQSTSNWGFNIDVQKDLTVSLEGSSATAAPAPAAIPTGPAHAAGTNIISGSTVYFISEDGNKRPYTSGGAFLSYGFNSWSDVFTGTDGDLALPTGAFVPPMDGSLINDKGTVYIITNGKRLGVSSDSVFRALGYSYRNVMPGDTSFMTTIGPVTSSLVAHPAGTLVNDNGTEYLNTCNGKLGIPTNEVFFSWGFSYAKDVIANTADRALSVLGLLPQRGSVDLSPTANTCQ